MILADSSIWIDHFRYGDEELQRIIDSDVLLCHPAVIGELALGSLARRVSVLAFLADQRKATVATHDEVMTMIEQHKIFSMGVGYTDAHLIASVLQNYGTSLWTRDRRLRAAADKAGAVLHLPLSASS